MTDLYITKNKSGDNLFQALRDQGIRHVQNLSGKVWTDYNIHDPGVTTLEQLCFGITELVYKAGFDVADLLTTADGGIDYEALGLFPPEQILYNQATTPKDYMKLIFDRVPEVAGVWVSPDEDMNGLWHVDIRLEKEFPRHERERIIQSVRDLYAGHRNLCEDIGRIRILENRNLRLEARVEISGHREPSLILARIYHDAGRYITRPMLYRDIHWDDDVPPDQVMEGPRLRHGIIDDDDVPMRRKWVDLPGLARVIREVAGVDAILEIALLEPITGQRHETLVHEPDRASVLNLEFPETGPDIQVFLYKKERLCPVKFKELLDQTRRLPGHRRELGHSTEEVRARPPLPRGRFRHPGQYHSIQELFPYIYGINHFGVPDSYPALDKARAKQLKSYLMLFEQIMANLSADIENLPRLFSIDPSVDRSYFSRILDDSHGPNLSGLYRETPDKAARELDDIMGKHDRFVERRNRIMDYLLGLYGESFTQNSLSRFNYYYPGLLFSRYLLALKLRFLRQLPRISRKRGSGRNILRTAWNTGNVSGLKHKTSLLLGFDSHEQRSLTLAFTRHGLELISDEEFTRLKLGTFEIQFVEPRDIGRRMAAPFKQVPYMATPTSRDEIHPLMKETLFMKYNLFNKSALTQGLDLSNFRFGSFSGKTWQVIFRPYPGSRWCYLASFRKRRTAMRAANHLMRFIRRLNIMSEGMHIVEHLLLRNGAEKDDAGFFPSRISVLFPAWTPRCSDPQFRHLAQETVRINAPAHVGIDFYWLDFRQMLNFEILFHDWLRETAGQTDLADGLSGEMIRFLQSAKKDHRVPDFL